MMDIKEQTDNFIKQAFLYGYMRVDPCEGYIDYFSRHGGNSHIDNTQLIKYKLVDVNFEEEFYNTTKEILEDYIEFYVRSIIKFVALKNDINDSINTDKTNKIVFSLVFSRCVNKNANIISTGEHPYFQINILPGYNIYYIPQYGPFYNYPVLEDNMVKIYSDMIREYFNDTYDNYSIEIDQNVLHISVGV